MLEILLDRKILVILMGIGAVLGAASKIAAGLSLKRLVKAAGNMNKSTHPLVRLVKAKFEHACMVSDRVQNVGVFVEKYLYEYRAAGLRLHTWRRMEKAGAGLCFLAGLAGAGISYLLSGMSDEVLRYGAAGAGLAILLVLFQMTSDEKYQLSVIRNYMVDHLENVCAHRYEKAQSEKLKEEWRTMAPPDTAAAAAEPSGPEVQKKAEETGPEIKETAVPVPEIRSVDGQAGPEVQAEEKESREETVRFVKEQAKERPARETRNGRTRKEQPSPEVSQEVRIREILEEFLA